MPTKANTTQPQLGKIVNSSSQFGYTAMEKNFYPNNGLRGGVPTSIMMMQKLNSMSTKGHPMPIKKQSTME